MCTYLASDHRKENCTINWDRGLRGLLLVLHNAVGLFVYIHHLDHTFLPQQNQRSFSLRQYLENFICRSTVDSVKCRKKGDLTDTPHA